MSSNFVCNHTPASRSSDFVNYSYDYGPNWNINIINRSRLNKYSQNMLVCVVVLYFCFQVARKNCATCLSMIIWAISYKLWGKNFTECGASLVARVSIQMFFLKKILDVAPAFLAASVFKKCSITTWTHYRISEISVLVLVLVLKKASPSREV